MSITAQPLCWPMAFPRSQRREAGRFQSTLAGALKNVEDSLRLFAKDSGKKLEEVVISSNYSLGVSSPADPGVAVWFTWDGMQVCIPVDRYSKIEHNLQAIHHIVEARRTELRHGTLALVRASFTGFRLLAPPAGYRTWQQVLGFERQGQIVTLEMARAAYKSKASEAHPDKGGSDAAMAEVNRAWEEAQRAFKPQ